MYASAPARTMGCVPVWRTQFQHNIATRSRRQGRARPSVPPRPRATHLTRPEPVESRAQQSQALGFNLARQGVSPLKIRDELSKAGLLPLGHGKYGSYEDLSFGPASGPGYFLAKVLGNLAEAAVSSPAGIVHLGKDVGLDVAGLTHGHGLNRQYFPRTRRDVSQIAQQTVHDFQHPLDRPGYTLIDAFGALSGGAGLASRAAGAAGALGEEGSLAGRLAAAAARPGHAGGSLLHRPEPGTAKLTVGDVTVERPLSRNVAARQVQKARVRAQQRALDRGGEQPFSIKPRALEKHFSAQASFGRELRAQRRVEGDLARAPLLELERSMRSFGRGLSPAEHKALNVVAVEGVNAFHNPAEAVGRHVALHEQWARDLAATARKRTGAEASNLLKQAKANRDYARSLQAALKVLQRPSKRFLNAVEQAHAVSHLTEQELISRGLLHPSSAEGRLASIAAVYRGAEYVRPTPSRLGEPTPALVLARKRVERLQKTFDRANARREQAISRDLARHGAKAAQPPAHTLASAQARLGQLERVYGRLVNQAMARKRSDNIGIDQARQLLAEHDAKIHQAEQRLAAAKDAVEKQPPRPMVTSGNRPRVMPQEMELSAARRDLAKLTRERRRFADAARTGWLRVPLDRSRIAVLNRKAPGLTKHEAEMERQMVEQDLRDAAARSSHPSAKAFTAHVREMERLQRGVAHLQGKYAFTGSRPTAGELLQVLGRQPTAAELADPFNLAERVGNTVVVRVPGVSGGWEKALAPGSAAVERIGGALSVAKDELARLEKAAAARVRPTGFVGGGEHTAPVGSFYFPLTPRYTEGHLTGPSGMVGVRGVGAGGVSPPTDSAYVSGLGQRFTAASVRSGKLPSAAQAIGDRYARVMKLASVHDLYDTLYGASTPTKTSEWDVPIGSTKAVREELRRLLSDVAEQVHANPDEAAKIDHQALERFQQILEHPQHQHLPVGASVEGVRWVDRRLIQDLGETSVAGALTRFSDAVNNPARVAALYLRPAYALNAVGNVGMGLVTQGYLAPQATRWALKSRTLVGEADTAKIDAGMGMSRSQSYSIGRGPLYGMSDRLANAWNTLTDLWFRRAAFYHEAAKAGFRPERVGELLNDPAHRAKLLEVLRRARKNAVDFNSLTPLERNGLRHLVYFYPWVSRGSLWALRAMVEHPGKTYTVAQLARIGERDQEKMLGRLPEWAKLAGLIPLHAAHNGMAETLNPTSVWTPSTAAQAGQAIADTAKGIVGVGKGGALSQNLSPVLQLVAGQAVPDSTQTTAPGLVGMLESTPQAQALRRAGVWGKPSKTYPAHGVWPAAEPFVAGGLAPRETSVDALHAQARKELPADQRAYIGVYQEREQLWKDAQALGLLKHGQRVPKVVRDAFNLKAERARALALLDRKAPDYQHQAYAVDMGLLANHGILTRQQATAAIKGMGRYDELTARLYREKIWSHYGRGLVITYAKHAVNQAKRAKSAATR